MLMPHSIIMNLPSKCFIKALPFANITESKILCIDPEDAACRLLSILRIVSDIFANNDHENYTDGKNYLIGLLDSHCSPDICFLAIYFLLCLATVAFKLNQRLLLLADL